MAGILANSATKHMVSGDTAASQTVSGLVAREQVTLTVYPLGATSWVWNLTVPDGSSAARCALSDDSVAAPTFTPDVTGTFTVTVTVDGTTTYTLGMQVVGVALSTPANPINLLPYTNAQIPTPTGNGIILFNSSTQGNVLTIKTAAGTFYTVNVTVVP